MVEISGEVIQVGKIKEYSYGGSWGDHGIVLKFFMKVKSEEHGEVLSMVEVDADNNGYGYKIPESADRQKPFVGDMVKFTTRSLKPNGNNDKWASVTFNQSFEITKINEKARKERDEWVAKKKAEREALKQENIDRNKQIELDNDLMHLGHLETQRHDDRMPLAVQEAVNGTFDFECIRSLLRDTTWFILSEGEGGRTAKRDAMGQIMEEGYPGTGLRRPGACLYGKNQATRKSILDKGIASGIILKTDKDTFKATKLGIETLKKIDSCPHCGSLRQPWSVYSHYSMNYGNGHGWSDTRHVGIQYHCVCEIKEIQRGNRASNCWTSYKTFKKINDKQRRINDTVGYELVEIGEVKNY